ncbi:unnamed protein product [Clonostachys rhizophaga]|uniref:Uncharacterized protein n=1 Tax=Clonostachys rhizophaga TaxID=160324 RepID=A0A9N9YVP8_9HYPO|nr:unnamed protein product [Clonostachys rhizophaga]
MRLSFLKFDIHIRTTRPWAFSVNDMHHGGTGFVALAAAASTLLDGAFASPDNKIPEQWRKSIPEAWDHTMARSYLGSGLNISGTSNWALDQIMDGQGTINICLRWGANKALTRDNRESFEVVYKQSFQVWLKWLPGWDNFPFDSVDIKTAHWAVGDRALIEGPTSGFEVHAGSKDDEGRPTCNPGCSRELHQDGDYSECPGGADNRFHQFILLNPAWGEFNMGAASSFGVDLSLHGW